ncbi:cell division protein FtsY [Sulfurifustis variabilis]|uniref:Signal recognition particle receptor FtsY n=1 Tax=Sulfurifustis variabilis TaxID=1675686 RepID=A0A1B4V6Y8_9GAMM|nr:signal recognition particle-docking protein FtsY [Sulfurifustis variabilis]BAU47064.1 cell division protein FtsY [Sulfurifustis variabilis]
MTTNQGATTGETKRTGFFSRLKSRLVKTQRALGDGLGDLLLGKRTLDQDLLDEIETALLAADVGAETTELLIRDLTGRLRRRELTEARAAYRQLRQDMLDIVRPVARPLVVPAGTRPYVVMVVGVNGVGKTTTIGKVGRRLKESGNSVMLAAGDTFRAAAIEQLKVWGERIDAPVIAQHTGADAAAVAHDAMHAARARGVDVLIVDTAGRQHTHGGLMDELRKIKRVIAKSDPSAPHEVLMVLDAGTGQNALSQLKHFGDAVGVTGIALTKLDGTAKGGILIAIARQSALPIRFIGVGEDVDDLQPFSAEDYVDALLPEPA